MTKRTKTIVAIILGATLLLTSAFADMILGSGYLALKDSLKTSAAFFTEEADSYTVKFKASFKEGNKTFFENEETIKINYSTLQRESLSKTTENGREIGNHYYYNDSDMSVGKDINTAVDNNEYFWANIYEDGRDYHIYRSQNPFEEEIVQDLEGVLDSFVGSLQDVIQLEQNDGSSLYTCNLDASQVPLYINGLLSMGIKYSFFNQHNISSLYLPEVTKNFYIKSGSGKATANEQNILTDAVICGEFSAEEDDGTKHDFQFEILFTVTDINSTDIEVPSIEGAEIDYIQNAENEKYNYITTTSVGKFVCYLSDVSDGYRYKTDEWILEITDTGDGYATGSLTHLDGDNNIITSEEFTAEFPEYAQWFGASFTYDGKLCTLQRYDDLTYRINFDVVINGEEMTTNGAALEFHRIFD